MGIDFEDKAFFDIVMHMSHKYDFIYPDDKLIELAKRMKQSSISKLESTRRY
nr:DUF3387 domain-containing protein [Photobacterium sp. NCIMB 13483]